MKTPGAIVRARAEVLLREVRALFALADELDRRAAPGGSALEADEQLIVGYAAAADRIDEPIESLRSAVRRKKLPCRKITGRVVFRVADLDNRKLAHALVAESTRPIPAGRFRPSDDKEKINESLRSEETPRRA